MEENNPGLPNERRLADDREPRLDETQEKIYAIFNTCFFNYLQCYGEGREKEGSKTKS